MDPTLLTIHNMFGHLHPDTRLFEAPVHLEPCVFRWTDATGEVDWGSRGYSSQAYQETWAPTPQGFQCKHRGF